MNARTRRWLLGAVILIAALFIGRWTAEFLAERWWAGTISPAARTAVVRWWLLGFALNVIAIGFASCWFVTQALGIARTITAVHITRHIGDLEVREAVPTKLLFWGAVAIGVLLGWISGAGAETWRAPVALAWQGVSWGAQDPLLGVDLGRFVAKLPVMELFYDFLLTLNLVGIAFTVTLYITIRAIRREGRGLLINASARQHLGKLFAALAATIGLGYLNAPLRLAGSELLVPNLDTARAAVTTSHWMVVLAIVTMIASLLWGTGKSHRFLALGWGALLVVIASGMIRASDLPQGIVADRELAQLHRQFTVLGWGINPVNAPAVQDSVPTVTAVWDEHVLRRAEGLRGRLLLAATPVAWYDSQLGAVPTWLLASVDNNKRRIEVSAVVDGVVDGMNNSVPVASLAHRIDGARSWPQAPEWLQVGSGVPANNLVSRTIIAWARQGGGILSLRGTTSVDWHIDPVDRAKAIMPMAEWLPADIMMSGDRAVWVMQGVIPMEYFPLSRRLQVTGGEVAGLVPAFIAIVDVASGAIQFYFDPAAGPLAQAWAGFAPDLLLPATSIPAAIRGVLPYSPAWAEIQLAIVDTTTGAIQGSAAAVRALPVPSWTDLATPVLQQVTNNNQIITLRRNDGVPEWTIDSVTRHGTAWRDAQSETFAALPLSSHLLDSVRAVGDSMMIGPLRWWRGSAQGVAWQPVFGVSQQNGVILLGIANAQHTANSLNRSIVGLWRSGTAPAVARADSLALNESVLNQARRWMTLADSALRRGDFTAFGRYWESLVAALKKR